jgi:putative FmdB family regulatory protein
MPVYDYKCASHGLFHELATMEDSAKPAPCPTCGAASGRVIMIAPEVLDMAPERKAAVARNEQSRHQPIISTTDSREEAKARAEYSRRKQDSKHIHHRGCGCSAETNQSSLKQQVVYLPDGSKVFPSQRPWMISH